MTDLSRERIAELRASRKPLTWGELLALLDAYEAQRPRPASEPMPTVLLETSGHVARASGEWRGVKWKIHAELESDDASRGGVWIESVGCVADVTVHRRFGSEMSDETQEVLAAILWSALRAHPPAPERDDG